VFFRREKNKHNGASYLFSFTKEDLVKHIGKRTIQTGRLFFSSSLIVLSLLILTKESPTYKVWELLISSIKTQKRSTLLRL